MPCFKSMSLVRFDVRLGSTRTRFHKATETLLDQRNIYILVILYPSLVRHSPWILLSTTSYSTSISGSVTASCQSLCVNDLICPSFLGCLAIYNLAVPSSSNRSISALFNSDFGPTQPSTLMR
ncbi:hypothetical protein P692DRAFT_20905030 [Suillus brevipes Sb2]|nr:hypothetical protein P692DRAFT_20905030 [Suillus brevipes Sb2]